MDNILKESRISKRTKTVFLYTSFAMVFIGLVLVAMNYLRYESEENKYIYSYYLGNVGYLPGLLDTGGFSLRYYHSFWELPYIHASMCCFGAACLILILYWIMGQMQIVVTNKRVHGKTYFGRVVDLPVDSISAVGSQWLNGIAVSTSSGKISFLFIENSKEIYSAISELIIARQEEKHVANEPIYTSQASNAEELKKYKELLDTGVITQEEFDAKKKQLLGL